MRAIPQWPWISAREPGRAPVAVIEGRVLAAFEFVLGAVPYVTTPYDYSSFSSVATALTAIILKVPNLIVIDIRGP